MAQPLAAIRAKLNRGDEHVRLYEAEERHALTGKNAPLTDIRVDIEDTGTCVITLAGISNSELPLQLGAIVGDAVHNYRGALDQLIYSLAYMDSRGGQKRIAPGRSLERTAFPASDNRPNFEGQYVQEVMLAGLTKRHRASLKRFQPYRGWPGPDPHPIRLLDDLSNDDKHRLTQPVLVCPQQLSLRIEPEDMHDCTAPENPTWTLNRYMLRRPFEPDTEICRIDLRITGPDPQVSVKGNLDMFVGFRNGAPTLASLEAIGEYIRRIVDFFAPEFGRPCARYLDGIEASGRLGEAPLVPAEATWGAIRREPIPPSA